MHVPFVDLRVQHRAAARRRSKPRVRGVFERGDFILGAAVEQFETEYAALIGTRHAIASAPVSPPSSWRCAPSASALATR